MEEEEKYKKYINIFNDYVYTFDVKNPMIARKIYHSYRVAKLAKQIAISLNLESEKVDLSYICGLFHDIGRFEQAKQSNSFEDKYFMDHGDYGYQLLKEGMIYRITDNKEEQDIILVSTKYHNKYSIGDVNLEEELFCKIVRDADKLDIMEYQITSIDGKYKLNENMRNQIYSEKLCKNISVLTPIDGLCRMICFIYDLNFAYSFNYLKDKKIMDKKLILLKEHTLDATEEEIKFVNEYLQKKEAH